MATLVASVISGAMLVEGDNAQAFYFHSMTQV